MTVICFESDQEWENTVRLGVENGWVEPVPMPVALNAPKVAAYVNHGRWLGDCPVCGSSRNLRHGGPFWCASCGNQRWQGCAVPVDWPTDADIAAIGEVLSVRERANQNYDPAEHLRHPYGCPDGLVWLAYENLLRGFRVPDLLKERAETWIIADWSKRGLADEMAGFSPERVA